MSFGTGDRAAILGRVREALREKAPLKHPARGGREPAARAGGRVEAREEDGVDVDADCRRDRGAERRGHVVREAVLRQRAAGGARELD